MTQCCHCSPCQRLSGAAFCHNAVCAPDQVTEVAVSVFRSRNQREFYNSPFPILDVFLIHSFSALFINSEN